MLGIESHTFDLCKLKFSFLYGNVISYLERIRDGKFPHSWLSSHSEKKVSPFAASPLMGKFSFTIPAKPFIAQFRVGTKGGKDLGAITEGRKDLFHPWW